LVLAKSSTTSDPIRVFSQVAYAGGGFGITYPNIQGWTSYVSGTTGTTVLNNSNALAQTTKFPVYLRVVEDASNRTYFVSHDNGVKFFQVAQEAVNTTFTTGAIGFGVTVGNAALAGRCYVVSWTETTP
jgi:hypothetical protein